MCLHETEDDIEQKDRRSDMKGTRFLALALLIAVASQVCMAEQIATTKDGKEVILFDDHTWQYKSNTGQEKEDVVAKYAQYLRKGVEASQAETKTACEMYAEGWRYTMPVPKSPKAAWGVTDGRTTWWNGWWYNENTKQYSCATPKKTKNGIYTGDNQNQSNTWRNGGAPSYPDISMRLLSKTGGPN